MTFLDELRQRIPGNDIETLRRQQILAPLIAAFEKGGQQSVSEVLSRQMEELERLFDAELAALEKKL